MKRGTSTICRDLYCAQGGLFFLLCPGDTPNSGNDTTHLAPGSCRNIAEKTHLVLVYLLSTQIQLLCLQSVQFIDLFMLDYGCRDAVVETHHITFHTKQNWIHHSIYWTVKSYWENIDTLSWWGYHMWVQFPLSQLNVLFN